MDITEETNNKLIKGNVSVNVFDKDFTLDLRPTTTGRELFDQIVQLTGIKAVWFFGLSFVDTKGSTCWLKLKNKVFTQDVGKKRPLMFRLRAKFYPEDIQREILDEASTRLFYLQVRELILTDQLYCPSDTSVLLASYTAQSTLGDYCPTTAYARDPLLNDVNMLPKRILKQYDLTPEDWENKITSFYKDNMGLSSAQAMLEYLCVAQDLEMYGITYYDIKNKKGTPLRLGVGAIGVYVYERINSLEPKLGFPWNEVRSIAFNSKKLIIKTKDESSPNLVVYVSRVRHNKQIISLCMGNHELYKRRRQHTGSGSLGDNRSSAIESTGTKTFDGGLRPSSEVVETTDERSTVSGMDAQTNGKVSIPSLNLNATCMSRIINSTSSSYPTITCLSSADNGPGSFREMLVGSASDEQLYQDNTKNNEDTKPAQEDLSNVIATFAPEEIQEESPPDFASTQSGIEPLPTVTNDLPEASDHERTDFQGMVINDNITECMMVMEPEDEDERKSETSGSSSSNQDASSVLTDREGSVADAVLNWRMNDVEIQHSKEAEQRTPHVIGSQQYDKLQELFEDLSRQEKEATIEDEQHREGGGDKYRTIRNIQRGFTNTRIAIFEAM